MLQKKITNLFYKISTSKFYIFCVSLALLPFLNHRVLRMAGDEKVYLSQSIEMARSGRWFIQTLAGEPSYFKGPLHYILVRIGLLIFGNQIIAGIWMNYTFALLSGLGIFYLVRKRWTEKNALLLAIAVALNIGVYTHTLVSQMEIEVYFFYTTALVCLGLGSKSHTQSKTNYNRWMYLFWITAGLAGWSKSPLHSVLIVTGAMLYWMTTQQLTSRFKEFHFWLSALIGICIGIVGYLPAAIFDYQNFYETFILREQFQKANNGRTWDYVTLPVLHFALPWSFIFFLGLTHFIRKFKKRSDFGTCDLEMVKLGLAMLLPTMLFWANWTYKGQNYNLPAQSAFLLCAWAFFAGSPSKISLKLAGMLGFISLIIFVIVLQHFWPLPLWWNPKYITLTFVSILTFSLIFLLSEDVRLLGIGAAAFFIGFGSLITPLGEKEILDLQVYINEHKTENLTYHYYDLDPSIWSEWSILQLATHQTMYGLHKPKQLDEATSHGHVILVQNQKALDVILSFHKQKKLINPSTPDPTITPWNRWLTKGKNAEGQSKWQHAWLSNDLRELEREFYIVRF